MMTNYRSDAAAVTKKHRGRPKKPPARRGKIWTAEETCQLIDKWGSKGGIPGIAKLLGRTESAIKVRAERLKLGPYISGGTYVSFNLLRRIIDGIQNNADTSKYAYTLMRWEREGLKIEKVRCQNNEFRVVDITHFWKWAKGHQELFDFSRFQENALGAEPDWVKQKRRVDRENARFTHTKKCRWTEYEINHLRFLLEQGTTWKELEIEFRRSHGAIRRKIYDLYLPRPISRRGKGNGTDWSDGELRTLVNLVNRGYCFEYCAEQLDRSASSVRGKVDYLKHNGKWSQYE